MDEVAGFAVYLAQDTVGTGPGPSDCDRSHLSAQAFVFARQTFGSYVVYTWKGPRFVFILLGGGFQQAAILKRVALRILL